MGENDRHDEDWVDQLTAFAKSLGMNPASFNAWMNLRGLPGKGRPKGNPLDEDEEERRMAMYDIAYTDGEAASLLRISKKAFATWRARRCLPPPSHKAPGRLERGEEERREAAFHRFSTDETAAEALGIKTATYRRWRVERGLPNARERRQGRKPRRRGGRMPTPIGDLGTNDPVYMAMVKADRPMTYNELVKATGLSTTTVVSHAGVLENQGLLRVERPGRPEPNLVHLQEE